MLRRSAFWFVTMAACVGMVLFRIKYEVIALEQHNTLLKKEILDNKDAIHHLKAEWTYLNDPKRLQASSKNHLSELKPVNSHQLITFQDMAGSSTPHKIAPAHVKGEPAQSLEKKKTPSENTNALDAYIDDFASEAIEGVHA